MQPILAPRTDEPLARYTSWRIGGPARFYSEASDTETVRAVLHWGRERNLPLLLLGGGTNLLICDQGFDGLVVRYRAQHWEIAERGTHATLFAQAGAPIGKLAWAAASRGWRGLEWAAGLPGTLGGAIYGNAGCYGSDIASVLESVTLLVDGREEHWTLPHLNFGYRTSALKQRAHTSTDNPPIILAAHLNLERDDAADLIETMRAIAARRKDSTPAGSTCGSVFKNPPGGLSAGYLIDQAGLKGTRHGNAEISTRHANYIVNLGGASSSDVLALIEQARSSVLQQSGVALELEIQLVGCDA